MNKIKSKVNYKDKRGIISDLIEKEKEEIEKAKRKR